MTAAQLTTEEKRSPEESTLVLRGEIDMATAHQLRSTVEELLGRSRRVVLDFEGITFCDSQGLSALIAVDRAAKARGVTLVFVNIGEFLQRLLDITGLRTLFMIED